MLIIIIQATLNISFAFHMFYTNIYTDLTIRWNNVHLDLILIFNIFTQDFYRGPPRIFAQYSTVI